MHKLRVEILSLDFLLSLSGQELDRIWIRESSNTFLLYWHFPEVGLVSLDLVVDKYCRESILKVLLKLGICLFALESKRISGDYNKIHMLHLWDEPQSLLFRDEIVSKIELL